MAAPAYSTTWPAAPSMPIWPIVPRIRSLAVTPSRASPSKRIAHRLAACAGPGVWVASTCSTSLVPMPNASAPNAPCVAVWRVAADDRHARLGDAELGADDVDDALAVGAERVERDAELGAVALERLDLDAADSSSLMRRGDRRAVGRDVVVGGGERAVRAADLAAGEPQAVEGLRAGDLVDEVQVDVDAGPGATSWASQILSNSVLVGHHGSSSSAGRPTRRPAGRPPPSPGFSKWWGRSASKVTQSPPCSAWRSPSIDAGRARRARRAAVSRAPGSWSGGSPGPPVTAPGVERVARDLGAQAGQRRGEHLVGVAAGAAAAALAGADDRDAAAPRRGAAAGRARSSSPRGDARGDLQRRARLAALDLGEHRRARRRERSARSRSERSIASRSARTRGPMATVASSGRHTLVRYHIQR